MGLFKVLKMIKDSYKHIKKYMDMSYEEFEALPEEELREAISIRMQGAERHKEVEECLSDFQGAKLVYYVVNYYDMEVQNGGLCQYFVNSSRETAPYILESLHQISAYNHEKLLKEFIKKNAIDLNDLESFIIEDVEEFEEQNERYPFDEFDEAFYDLYEKEPLDELVFSYAKEHLEDFA